MEYYRPQPGPPEKKDRTLIHLVLAGCGCLLLIAVLFGVFAGKFFRSLRAPHKTVHRHLQTLNRGNTKEAYKYFSQDFRRSTSHEDFRKSIEEFGNVFPCRDVTLNKIHVSEETAVVEGTITTADGSIIPVRYELLYEAGEWRINKYQWSWPGEKQTI